MLEIVEISGPDLDRLRALLTDPSVYAVRFAVDGGLKVSANQRMWSLPLGEVQA